MIPNKNLFIVSSCLYPVIGNINDGDRLSQTIETFRSIKEIPNSVIIFADASVKPIPQDVLSSLREFYDFYFNLSRVKDISELSSSGMKSQAETLLLLNTISQFKSNFEVMKILSSVRRIYKLSGRYKLTEDFDPKSYDNLFGKYVFKKRISSWVPKDIQNRFNSTDLLVTRLFSFCPSLIDNYIQVLINNFNYLNMGFDTEHAHYLNIDSKYLVEFDTIGVEGIIASNLENIRE